MPLSRYQIRNEYSLADPELYKVAGKDDPEALLEGVAMAGLVGALRQLGDLAEFAAEIFHHLHEEVMATAARGHGLIGRVQQLEAEFPSVERTLLSQTCHTSFLYNSGLDWRPNRHVDPNKVTQGDLPRFVMDLYEECRGPPRLFLLDKFDIAGAGACLKRFSDPSFFKADLTSSIGRKPEGQREKKSRKVKKRGPRWRNGDTPETNTSSHAKLHQLFLEESIESGGNDPERRVKLKKRQYAGSMFDQGKAKSYMEKFLDTCLPEQKTVHEICIDALALPWISHNDCDSGLEIVEIGTAASPLKESIPTDKNACSSPNTMEMVVKPSMNDFTVGKSNEVISSEAVGVTGFNHERCAGRVTTSPKDMSSEEFGDEESKSAVDDDRNSDEATSEADHYMDALATIESEVETDSECKKNLRYLYQKKNLVNSDTSEEGKVRKRFDAQSTENYTTSKNGNDFCKERENSSCSASVDTWTETVPDLDSAAVAVPSVIPNMDLDEVSVNFKSEEIYGNKAEDHAARSTVPVKTDDTFGSMQDFGEASYSSCLTDQNIVSVPGDVEANLRQNCLPSPENDELYSNAAYPDFASVVSDQKHPSLTPTLHCDEIIADAPERTNSGHLFHEKHPMHDKPDTQAASRVLLAKESKSSVSVASFKEDGNNMDAADMDVCSDIDRPLANQPISDFTHVETMMHSDLASCVDFSIPSTQDSSTVQSSAIAFMKGFDNKGWSSEEINLVLTPQPDFAAETHPGSQGDHSIKEVIASAQCEERAMSADVGQNNLFSPFSGTPQTSGLLSSSVILDAAETDVAAGFVSPRNKLNIRMPLGSSAGEMRGESMSGKLSSVLEPSETQDRWHNHPEKSNGFLSEHDLAETGGRYLGTEINTENYPVCITEDKCEAALSVPAFSSDVCKEVNPFFSEALDPVATVNHLDGSETQVIQAGGICDMDQNAEHDGKRKTVSHDAFSVGDCNPILVFENILDLHHDMAKVDHTETGIDGSTQICADNYHCEHAPMTSSSSLYLEKFQEQGLSTTGECQQDEDKLSQSPLAKLAEQKTVDPVQIAREHMKYTMSSVTSCRPSNLALPNVLLADNFQSLGSSDVVNALSSSENNSHDLQSASSHQNHLDKIDEDNQPLGHNLSEPIIPSVKRLGLLDDGSKVKPLYADKLSSQSINSTAQIQTPQQCVEHEGSSTPDVCFHGLPSVSQLPLRSTEHTLQHSMPPMVKSTSTFPSNGIFVGNNLATEEVENSSQTIYSQSSPISMLPAEPQVSLDPPPLPPLPPMQWRRSIFRNSYVNPQQEMGQHTISPVQPVPATVSEIYAHFNISGFERKDNVSSNTQTSIVSKNKAQTSADGYAAQQEVSTLSMIQNTSATREGLDPFQSLPAVISEVASHNEMNGIRREYNPSFSIPSSSIPSEDGTQLLTDSYVAQRESLTLPKFTSASEVTSQNKMNGTIAPPVSVTSPIGNSLSEGLCQQKENACASGSSEGVFNGHSLAVMEVKVDAASGSHLEKLEHVSQMNGTRKEYNQSLHSPSTSIGSQVSNQNSEDFCQPIVDPCKPESFEGDLSSEHSHSVVEANLDAEFGAQDKLPECISQVTEQRSVDSLTQSPAPSMMRPPPGFVAPEVGRTWLSPYDGILTEPDDNTNGTLQKKPLRLRNPLIVEVVAIDKSKLRKVERVKPPVEPKPEGEGSFLREMQLRKVERVKPAVGTKSEEESSLEHLQLKKVGEIVKTQAEQREFPLGELQLRKVEDRVKLHVEPKSEGESLLKHVQLRKVGERVKPEVEQKPIETESPGVQLKKVGERVKSEFEQKPEETESPRVQLKKVGERVKSEFEQKPEEMESPRAQLRSISERPHPPVESKTEERDSLLDQIKNKSFNLKPSVVTRPTIQGPRTNLKVAAILEKASNIRQAMAGSDEEDDADNWSDH